MLSVPGDWVPTDDRLLVSMLSSPVSELRCCVMLIGARTCTNELSTLMALATPDGQHTAGGDIARLDTR